MRVLIIDDNESCLRTMESVVEFCGDTPVCFQSPVQALEVFREAPESYQLVLVDYKMPGMRGDDFIAEITRIAPRTRIVLISGCINTEISTRMLSDGVLAVFRKPVETRQLCALLRLVNEDRIPAEVDPGRMFGLAQEAAGRSGVPGASRREDVA